MSPAAILASDLPAIPAERQSCIPAQNRKVPAGIPAPTESVLNAPLAAIEVGSLKVIAEKLDTDQATLGSKNT